MGNNKSQWSRSEHDGYDPPRLKDKNVCEDYDNEPYRSQNTCNLKMSQRNLQQDIDEYQIEEHRQNRERAYSRHSRSAHNQFWDERTSPVQQETYGHRGREYDGHRAQYNRQYQHSPWTLDNYKEEYLQDYPSMSWPSNFLRTKKPADPDLADLLNGIITSTAKAIQHTGNNGNISASRKSAKILNGVNKYSVKGWGSRKFNKPVPEMFIILDSNENATTKFQVIENKLLYAQQANSWVNFTLWNQMVTDMSKHLFQFDPDEKHMLRGFMPFCLQKMEKSCEIELQLLEEKMENTTFTSLQRKTAFFNFH